MTQTALDIRTPRVFAPLLQPARYKGVWGGRGSGKSHFFAEMLVEQATLRPGLRAVCIREIQKSLAMSVKQLVTDKIMRLGLADRFELLDKEIRTPGGGVIIFQGMQNHTADSIKSLEGFDIAWAEEAQSLSAHSLKLLRPTIRKPGSEIWFSWNPSSESDPVDAFMRAPGNEGDREIVTICANWSDNPWFPKVLNEERKRDLSLRPDEYDHIWEGDYQRMSEAVIFRRRVHFDAFETPEDVRFYYGVDWGFSKDPTAVVRCFIADDVLHIDHEAGGVGIELDRLPALLDSLPGARDWPIKADNARPETISYLANRHGFRITGADKWKGSVEDGIEHLKAYKAIRVHPRCPNTAQEFRLYRYKVDRLTGDILPKIEDANNHYIDACIAEGERVWTERGHVPIESVAVADRVMTRNGFKRVLAARMTGENRPVWEIIAGGKRLLVTQEHRVFTCNRGFVRVDELKLSDILLLEASTCQKSKSRLPYMAGRHTGDTLPANAEQTPYITSDPSQKGNASISTDECGKTTTAQYRKGSIFTIKTVIPAITTLAIWKLSRSLTMRHATRCLQKQEYGVNGIWSASGHLQKNGTLPLKGWLSIGALGLWLIKTSRAKKRTASIASVSSHAQNSATQTNSALTPASRHGDAPKDWITLQGNACTVQSLSPVANTQNGNFVAAPVDSITAGVARAPRVYDLTIEDTPEFFASGVLVHNCRYALDGVIQSRRTMPDFSAFATRRVVRRSFV